MTRRRPCPLAPGPLEPYAAAFDELFASLLCRALERLWPALWTFLEEEGVAPTNNRAEQALRPAVLWRKGSFGTHSDEGARFVERLLTVTATCRHQGRSVLDYLTAAGRNPPGRSATRSSSLSKWHCP